MKHSFLLLLLALLVSASGCQRLQETDPDTPLKVKVGKEFTIIIQSNPSTGYTWRLAEPLDETLVQFVEKDYRADKPVRPGSGGRDIWKFEAVSVGETEITFNLFPPSASDATSHQTVTFTVVVR